MARGTAPGDHGLKAELWIEGADQDRAAVLGDDIQAPVQAVRPIDVSVPCRPEHGRVGPGMPPIAVGSRIIPAIGFSLDNHSANAINQQTGSDETRS